MVCSLIILYCLYVSPEDGYHVRIGSKEYFDILFSISFGKQKLSLLRSSILKSYKSY